MVLACENLSEMKQQLLEEYNFFNASFPHLLKKIHSNREGIKETIRAMRMLVKDGAAGLETLENLKKLNYHIEKINTYIAIAILNEVEDHALALHSITRLTKDFILLHLNKLEIIKELKVDAQSSHLKSIASEIALMHQLEKVDLKGCEPLSIPETLKAIMQSSSLKVSKL